MKIIIALAALFLAAIVFLYNRLVYLRTKTEESFSGIDVALSKRCSLLSNLNETVKAAALHEENVIKELTVFMEQMTIQEKSELATIYQKETARLLALAENYPKLKGQENFLMLQREISDAEEHLQAARRFYNSNAAMYNQLLKSFPASLLARCFDFKEAEYFSRKD